MIRDGVRRFVYLALLVAAVFVPAVAPAGVPGLPGTIAYSGRYWQPYDDSWEIVVFKASDGSPRALTEKLDCFDAYGPAWSPDGSMLAFVCPGKGISVMWHDGTGFRHLSHAEGQSPSWSPDRREVAFVGKGWIWIENIWSGQKRKVTRSFGYHLSWSPDGSRIVFDRRGKNAGIWSVRIDGRGLRRLTRGEDSEPAWSPDGRKIAFMGHGLSVMEPAGTRVRRVRGAVGYGPAWSPDSRWIATMDDSPRYRGIWVVPADGGRARRLVIAGQPNGVSWSP